MLSHVLKNNFTTSRGVFSRGSTSLALYLSTPLCLAIRLKNIHSSNNDVVGENATIKDLADPVNKKSIIEKEVGASGRQIKVALQETTSSRQLPITKERIPSNLDKKENSSSQIEAFKMISRDKIFSRYNKVQENDLEGLKFWQRMPSPFDQNQANRKREIKYRLKDVDARMKQLRKEVRVLVSGKGESGPTSGIKDIDLDAFRTNNGPNSTYSVFKSVFFSKADKETNCYQENRRQKLKGSARLVFIALASNLLVTAAKFAAFMHTGSASMMSEGIHSLADASNQFLLAIGISRSLRAPDAMHPYGYGGERYVWALISGVGIFFVGCGVSTYHGIMGMIHPHPLEHMEWAFGILVLSGIIEGGSLAVAYRQVVKNAKDSGLSLRDYIKEGSDPNDIAVLFEDTAAVLGLGIAAGCLGLTHVYDNPIFDALGSVTVGGLLGVCATLLIHRNKDALLGRAIPAHRVREIVAELEKDPVIRSTHDVKTLTMGVDSARFKAEISFDGQVVTKRYLEKVMIENLLREMNAINTTDEVEEFMIKHGAGVVDMVGEEVDRIEQTIQKVAPEVRHVDLEVL